MSQSKTLSVLKTIGFWTPYVLFGLLFVMQGVIKLAPQSAWLEMFAQWGYPDHFYLMIGVLELAGGIGLFVPRWAGYAGALLGVIMLGASATHLVHAEGPQAIFTFVLAILLFALAYFRRPKSLRAEFRPSESRA